MKRKPPSISVPKVVPHEKPGIVQQARRYKLITPLYGGGEEPGKADSVTTVRATEVRGHLRFWWRATRGGAFNGDLSEMRRREETIWGSAAGKGPDGAERPGPSQVVVRINDRNLNEGRPKRKIEVVTRKGKEWVDLADYRSPWSYVAFPLRKKPGESEAGHVRENVSFELKIKYPQDFEKDVAAAIWAWEVFGGIGARTRRGFGALECLESDGPPIVHKVNSTEVKNKIEEELNSVLPADGKWPSGVPHLSKNPGLKIVAKKNTPLESWEALITALKNFRQDEAREKGSGKAGFGLSQWPEANAIRVLFNKPARKSKHRKSSHVVQKFPRAVFGLPLPFHMFHDKDLPPLFVHGIEYAENKWIDRMASPLILRPISCEDGAVGLVLVLEWEPVGSTEPYTPPGGLALVAKEKEKMGKENVLIANISSKLTSEEPNEIPPMRGKGKRDVLQAFLDFVSSKWGEL